MPYRLVLSCLFFLSLPLTLVAQPIGTTDLTNVAPDDGLYRRLLGSVGNGSSGVPVAGGFDLIVNEMKAMDLPRRMLVTY